LSIVLFGKIVDCYNSLDAEGKNALRIMDTPATMFKKLWKEIETEVIGAKLDYEEKPRVTKKD